MLVSCIHKVKKRQRSGTNTIKSHIPPSKLKEKEAHSQIDKPSRKTCTVNQMNSSFPDRWSFSYPKKTSLFSVTNYKTGPGCSKLTTSLVNVSLKFQTLISEKCQNFLLKKCEKLLQCKSFSHFFNKKFQCIRL